MGRPCDLAGQGDRDRNIKVIQQVLAWYPEKPSAVNACVHQQIQSHAEQHPEAQAICSLDGDLTYAELDFLSSRLSNFLANHGVTLEVIVPLCFERSSWVIVCMLAVLKAGGAFLLLDLSQPLDRLKNVVHQTGASLALSSAVSLELCNKLVDRAFVVNASTILTLEGSSPLSCAKPSNMAYIMFTSGSTGSPKGVMIEHSQLATSAMHCGRNMDYQSRPRVLQFASYAFDACILEMITTLVFGGTVCIPSQWERENSLIEAIRRMNVSTAIFTPSLLQNLELKDVPSLKTIIVGGESPPTSLIDRWASKVHLISAYGPTECCVTCFIVDASRQKYNPGDIGLPFGVRPWIVKEENYHELAGIGDLGELLIEGPVVGRGYLNDTAKTERHFLQCPSWVPRDDEHQDRYRFYRTGDLARYLDDGTINYAGRIDRQVKIRGQRLELAEVEHQLHDSLRMLEVNQHYVVVEPVTFPGLTNVQLVAFLMLDTPLPIGSLQWSAEKDPILQTSTAEQERFSMLISQVETIMRSRLPAYAIPNFYVPLRDVPLCLTGKLDRKRLHNAVSYFSAKDVATFLESPTVTISNETVASQNEVRLHKVWSDIFKTCPDAIGPHDNFFALGGDSVIAIRLVALARERYLDLNLEIVIKYPILRDMAANLQTLSTTDNQENIVPEFTLLDNSQELDQVHKVACEQCSVTRDLIEDIYPCTLTQSSLLASSFRDPGAYIMQLCYKLPASIDIDRFKKAWNTVTERIPILHTRIFDYNGDLLQAVVREPPHWQVVDDSLEHLLASEKTRRATFGERMLWHTILRDPSSMGIHFVWTVHHSFIDGWSESLITDAVAREYLEHSGVKPTIGNFNNFIDHIKKQDAESAKAFWKKYLENAPALPFPQLPNSTSIPHATSMVEHEIPPFQRNSFTATTLVQAAWTLLMGLYTRSSDFVYGITLNGRTTPIPGIDRIPGPVLTTVPFRTKFSPDQKLADYLQAIQHQYIDIIPFEQYGLSNIRRLDPLTNTACGFQTILVVQPVGALDNTGQLFLERKCSYSSLDCALMLECELRDKSFLLRATFDEEILNSVVVQRLLQQMEHLLQRLSVDSESQLISSIQKIPKTDVSQLFEWNGVSSCLAACSRNTSERGASPFSWIVDPEPSNNLTPIGGIGELWVQVPGLSSSYISEGSSIVSVIVEDPPWWKSVDSRRGVRFFRTGELASYRYDGSILFRGRLDTKRSIVHPRCGRNVREVEDARRPKSSTPANTSTESRLMDLWKLLLKTEQVEFDDNFFQLGGDSLTAMRLVSVARKEGLSLTVDGIFKSPSLRNMASIAQVSKEVDEKLPPFGLLRESNVAKLSHDAAFLCGIKLDQIEDIYPSSVLQRHWFVGEEGRPASDESVWEGQMAFSLPSSVDLERFRSAWISAARHHAILRTRFVNTSSGMLQVVVKESAQWESAKSLQQYLEKDKLNKMRYGDRLMRLATIEPEDPTHERYFVLTAHHSVYDGHMMNLLFKEIQAIYKEGDSPNRSPSKPNSYIKYIMEANKHTATSFWTSYLAGALMEPLFSLPQPPKLPQNTTKQISITLSPLEHAEITLSTLVELATSIALAIRLSCPDIILHSTRSGRASPMASISSLLAPTVTLIPLRFHLDASQPISSLYYLTQQSRTEMLRHEHLTFVELRSLPHLAGVLRHSIHIDINPHPARALWTDLPLELRHARLQTEEPFGIFVELDHANRRLELIVFSDDDVVPREVSVGLLEDIRNVLDRMIQAKARPGSTVGKLIEEVKRARNGSGLGGSS